MAISQSAILSGNAMSNGYIVKDKLEKLNGELMKMKEYCFETLHLMYLLGKISIKDGCRFNLKEIMNPLQSQHDRNVVMYIGENTYLKGFDNYDVILFTKDGNKLAVNVEDFIEYIGEK